MFLMESEERHVSQREWEQQKPWTSDKVCIRSLKVLANAGHDCWQRQAYQPVEISVDVGLCSVSSTAVSDALDSSTLDYGALSKHILKLVSMSSDSWYSAYDFGDRMLFGIRQYTFEQGVRSPWMSIDIYWPEATLTGEGTHLCISRSQVPLILSTTFSLRNLSIPITIGIRQHERGAKQTVDVSLSIDRVVDPLPSVDVYHTIEQRVIMALEHSSFETLESLCEHIAAHVILHVNYMLDNAQDTIRPAGVRVKIEKPKAISQAEAPALEVYRRMDDIVSAQKVLDSHAG